MGQPVSRKGLCRNVGRAERCEAGLDPEKYALLNTHILAFDPLEAPIGSTGGVKA